MAASQKNCFVAMGHLCAEQSLAIRNEEKGSVMKRSTRRCGFSYVGDCQQVGDFYMGNSFTSRHARVAQALLQPERSERAGGPCAVRVVFGLTSRQPLSRDAKPSIPRRVQSAIRAAELDVPAHEIEYERSDAHSHSRALPDVESLAHKTSRAVAPRHALRGPAVQCSPCLSAPMLAVGLVVDHSAVHPSQLCRGLSTGWRLLHG